MLLTFMTKTKTVKLRNKGYGWANAISRLFWFLFFYTVSQKTTPDIIDCNLKKDDQILIVFGTNIPDTTGTKTVQVTHLT